MKTILASILLTVVFFKPTSLQAQSPVFKEATLSHPADLWKSVKLDDAGNNILNGLHFYAHGDECNSQKVKLIKLINTNNYAVKFEYQVNEASPVVSVIVPASVTIEGSCSTLDNDIKKLVITVPDTKPEDAKKNKEYFRQHITVTPFK